jgi:peptidoglycan hydrolase CwlO-like protein
MRRLWPAFCAAALIAVVPLSTAHAVTLQQLEQQQQQTSSQLNAEQSQLQQTQNAIVATETRIQQMNAQVQRDQARVAYLNGQVQATQAEITATQNQITAINRHLHYEASLLTAQVRLMEEHGAVGYLEVILGAKSFSDFLSRLYMLSQVATMATNLVDQIKAQDVEMHQKQAQLLQQKAQLVSLQQQAVNAANQEQVAVADASALEVTLHAQVGQESSYIAQLKAKLASIVQQIQQLLAQYNGGYLSQRQLFSALYPLVSTATTQLGGGLPPALVIAVITEESGGNQRAVSYTGAVGLMQVEPSTAAPIEAELGLPPSALYNAEDNLLIGCFELRYLLDYFGGSNASAQVTPALAIPPGNSTTYLSEALAGYNAGPGNVTQYGLAGLYAQSWGASVQRYVANIEALYLQYASWTP